MKAKLSVNINKFATLRNARGNNNPDLVKTAINCQLFGAEGITIHPRPDERHIRYTDVPEIKKVLTTEYNIEGNPKEDKFVKLVLENRPDQVTLVPDAQNVLTSNSGWNTKNELNYLKDIITLFKKEGIRTSIFIDPVIELIEYAAETGTDRIELYTEDYARKYSVNREMAIEPYVKAAEKANQLNIGLNAGHDLSLENLRYFSNQIPNLLEVSIGHALICDALYYGLENTISMYKKELKNQES